MEPILGLEPRTFALLERYSTIELNRQPKIFWSQRGDSNPRSRSTGLRNQTCWPLRKRWHHLKSYGGPPWIQTTRQTDPPYFIDTDFTDQREEDEPSLLKNLFSQRALKKPVRVFPFGLSLTGFLVFYRFLGDSRTSARQRIIHVFYLHHRVLHRRMATSQRRYCVLHCMCSDYWW